MLLTACGVGVPQRMEFRAGIDPRFQDDDVRFRSTYYFRVFDICTDEAGQKRGDRPIKDSLYRFRMTGKASSHFNKVHFESGTLHKGEIDPFGANVEFNEKTGRFQFVARKQSERQAEREVAENEVRRRVQLLREMASTFGRKVEDLKDDDPLLGEMVKSLTGLSLEGR